MASIVLVALKGLFKQFTVLGKLIKTSKIDAVSNLYEMFCAIRYHLYNFKNVKNTYEEFLHFLNCTKGPSIKCVRKIFRKTNISNPLIRTRKILCTHLIDGPKWYKITQSITYEIFNPFRANVPFLYPLKNSEHLWFSGIFRGCKNGTLAQNKLILFL